MEGVMQDLVAGLQGTANPDTPLGQAQHLMYQAFREKDAHHRVRLARQALELCPDCADALVMLAEHAPNRREALRLYEQGVAAGERALGPEVFQREVGRFWGLLETRPYMRARLGLANSLWTAGRREEAVRHWQDLLRLNPGDNQGVRYTLAGFLLFLDRDDDLDRLLRQYSEEGSAAWAYTRAVLAFRRQGDTAEARDLLAAAVKTNQFIPDYLLGQKFPPATEPPYYGRGDENEAVVYISGFLPGWKSTPGAVAWLRTCTRVREPNASPPKGPLGFVKKWLRDRLPQEYDVWQADFRPLPTWIRRDGDPIRPWIILAASRSNKLVLAHLIQEEPPTPGRLWDTLVQAMQHPVVGDPHRPTELQVPAREQWVSLKLHIEEVGIGLTTTDELEALDEMFEHVIDHVCGKPLPGLLSVPGVTPAQAASVYRAAAAFFRQAPWKKVGYEAAIRVECDRFQGGPWFAVLMGQSGLTIGLALYEDLQTLRRMWSNGGDEQTARRTVATSVTFGEEWDIPVADLDAAKTHGWEIARPDAWPALFHKDRGRSMRSALAWELELMEGCLRAVPDFVDRRRQDDPGREEVTVPAASEELKLVLSWVEEA
jgi:tetratricopeptide (TPR) repeat protein